MNKILYTFLILIACCLTTVQANTTSSNLEETNTVEGIYPELLLSNIELINQTEKQLFIRLSAFNMSREIIVFGDNPSTPENLKIKFEEAFNRSPLFPYKDEITSALFDLPIELPARKMYRSIELAVDNTRPLAEKYVGQSYDSSLFPNRKKIAKKSNRRKKTTIEQETAITSTPQKEQETVIATAPKKEKSKRKNRRKKSDLDSDESVLTDAQEAVIAATNGTTSYKEEKISTTESEEDTVIAVNTEDDGKASTKKPKKRKVKQEQKESVSFTANTEDEENERPESNYYDKRNCPDLVITDVEIVKNQNDKWLTISYTLTNEGNRKADLYGESGNDSDNVGVKVFLATSPSLSRGSIPLGGSIITSGLKDGLLQPNESYTGTIKLDIRKKTRFTSYIILSADPFNNLVECDKTNNKNHLYVD